MRGFVELGYLWGDRDLTTPNAPATLGWAAATKAYADDGGIERLFRAPLVARSYLKHAIGRNVDGLTAPEVASLATNLHLARRAGAAREWVLARVSSPLTTTLDGATAGKLLRNIGSHESVGSARAVPLVVRPCSERDALAALRSPL